MHTANEEQKNQLTKTKDIIFTKCKSELCNLNIYHTEHMSKVTKAVAGMDAKK